MGPVRGTTFVAHPRHRVVSLAQSGRRSCHLVHSGRSLTLSWSPQATALFANVTLALGTAADAKAMLDKTVAALKADKAKTLDEINKGENGFLVGDIYPFYFNMERRQSRRHCQSKREERPWDGHQDR